MPTLGLQLIGSVSFFIMPEMVPGRISLLLTLTLVLINFFIGIQEKMPKTGGLTAIGIYLLFAMGIIFVALFEYAWILFKIQSINCMSESNKVASNESSKISKKNKLIKIDQISWIAYIITLITFNIIYITLIA